jgi:hypothetical protein
MKRLKIEPGDTVRMLSGKKLYQVESRTQRRAKMFDQKGNMYTAVINHLIVVQKAVKKTALDKGVAENAVTETEDMHQQSIQDISRYSYEQLKRAWEENSNNLTQDEELWRKHQRSVQERLDEILAEMEKKKPICFKLIDGVMGSLSLVQSERKDHDSRKEILFDPTKVQAQIDEEKGQILFVKVQP